MAQYDRATTKGFRSEDGSEYFYTLTGDTKKDPLVLVPGFTGTHSDLLPFADYLRDDFFIIMPDLPGWGKSPRLKKTLTLKNYAQYIHSLLEDQGIKSIYLFGHCMGATIALQFALLYPHMVKQLIIVSTPYNKGLLSQRLFLHLADISNHTPKFFRPLLFLWRSRPLSTPVYLISMQFKTLHKKARIILRGIKNQPLQDESVVEENWISLVHFRYEKIKGLTMPIFILHGDKDYLVNPLQAAKLQELLPHATLRYIEGSGHMPPVETPGTLASLIKDYLGK